MKNIYTFLFTLWIMFTVLIGITLVPFLWGIEIGKALLTRKSLPCQWYGGHEAPKRKDETHRGICPRCKEEIAY